MRKIAASCLLTVLVAIGGCSQATGPRTVRVWGDVSYDGRPIEDGTVDFISTDGARPAQAQIKAGHYDLAAASGPEAGKTYRIEISSLVKSGKKTANIMGDGEPMMEPLINIVPPRYNTQSTLTATIVPESSDNKLDFILPNVGVSTRR